MGRRRRRRVEPTEDWEQVELLCAWDEQREYERIRPLVLFGEPVPERAQQTGTSERTLYRRIAVFEQAGEEALYAGLLASLCRLIVDLKAEHPALNLNEIANICYVRPGRRPHLAPVRSVLDEEGRRLRALRQRHRERLLTARAAVGPEVPLTVTAHKNLNPGGVLSVALGVPIIAGVALFGPVFVRRRNLSGRR